MSGLADSFNEVRGIFVTFIAVSARYMLWFFNDGLSSSTFHLLVFASLDLLPEFCRMLILEIQVVLWS